MAGADPTDSTSFPETAVPRLRAAVMELSWLLGRGYAESAAATLVGDHHQLQRRQRMAVRRSSCSDAQQVRRRASREEPSVGIGPVAVDTLNQLITVERALGGGAVLRGRDGALRDVAGVHGSWRRTAATAEALRRLVEPLGARQVVFVIDAPVSNSGRLAAALRDLAQGRPWTVELSNGADRRLIDLALPVATSDGAVLDRAVAWVPLVQAALPVDAWIVDLG